MNKLLGLRILTTTLAGVMTLSMLACNKAPDTAGSAAPSVSVGTEIDDSLITTKVKAALLKDDDIKALDIQVSTRKGQVVLNGFVNSQTQLDRATSVAKATEGVKGVDNKLSLKQSETTVGNKIDDGLITTKVKAALINDASIKSLDISVSTHNGEVQLSGFVNNQQQVDRAVEVTKGVTGVSQVLNNMKIKN